MAPHVFGQQMTEIRRRRAGYITRLLDADALFFRCFFLFFHALLGRLKAQPGCIGLHTRYDICDVV